ncbi:alginate O-acetyltransferase AlgX-related protein [Cognatiyoonia sp. IB215182]|uniref:alginate O-acetyltransferase AlgX-related protein n=1 Tax=Cognatiyoonia sp. IB215182 TaxID=3097353 RepID=UPI002A12871D|nr:hypothetical protein [Cognatiyoonia sp. IB215182]MDX8354904.1 hypothetical protein [Cognatiyoonia sp. IB215182]
MKLTIPAAFFGYALFANYALLAGDVDTPELQGFMKGEFASEVDDIYRANLPHRDVAVSWIGAARYALLGEGRSGVVVGRDNWLFSAEEFRVTDDFSVPMTWIAEVDAQLAAMGTELVVVPLPAKLEIDAAQFGADGPPAQIAQTYNDFLAALGAHGITYVDTRPALLAIDQPFFATDTHWTTAGAAAVARSVKDVIGAGDTAFDRVDDDTERFTGDLVTFVTSDGLAPLVGLQNEEITPYTAEAVGDVSPGTLDLFGTDMPASMTLVGTSYSANPRWSFEAALKLALQQDVINYAEEGQGPVAPMHAFLERVDPVAPPPVVIWEFPVRYLSDPDLMKVVMQESGNA